MGCGNSTSNTTANRTGEKSAQERKEAWETIQKTIPRQKTPEDKQRRIDLFQQFDTNNNGKLTFFESYSGCVNILHLDEFTNHLRDIVRRSFNKARSMGNQQASTGDDDYVEFLEFRLMLCYIYDYFELSIIFDEIDTSGNMLIDEEEFKQAVPRIEAWGLPMPDADGVFRSIDKNGSGTVTFDEFITWATAKKLELQGDPDGVQTSAPVAPAPVQNAPRAANTKAAEKKKKIQEGKTAQERKAAWEKIRQELPRQKTTEDKQRRIDLFKQFDVNNNSALTLQESYNGCRDVMHLDDFTTRLYDIVMRAFSKAKDLGTKDRDAGSEDLVEFLEFRMMLCYIYDYFALTVVFDEIDTSGDMLISRDEFKQAVPTMEKFGVAIPDPDATFDSIDDNGSGVLTFDEFAAWAASVKAQMEKNEKDE